MFRIMDLNDFHTTFAVFLMLFVFISVIWVQTAATCAPPLKVRSEKSSRLRLW